MRRSNDIVIRPATEGDDAAAIAKLIYLTDPYIYPFLCDDFSVDVWVDFVRRALQCPNHVHSAQNMTLAVKNGKIVGLICAYPLPSDKIFLLPVRDDVRAKYAAVWEGYYKHADDCEPCLYISNLCVDPSCRGLGIGSALLKTVLDGCQLRLIRLDVLADNAPAVQMYSKAGFNVASQYNGFSGLADKPVKCFSMTYPRP